MAGPPPSTKHGHMEVWAASQTGLVKYRNHGAFRPGKCLAHVRQLDGYRAIVIDNGSAALPARRWCTQYSAPLYVCG